MSDLALACRITTTFAKSGEIDEEAQRKFLQRFIDAKIAPYMGSGGVGEGHALSRDELRQLYKIAVAHCRGRIPVYANPPEQYTARATIEHAQLAIDCGVEMLNLYGPCGVHGYRPTDEEYLGYHDQVLGTIEHPIAVSPNPTQGYKPKAALVAEICNKYPQVVAVNLVHLDESYFIELKNALKRDVALYVPLEGSMHTFALGADGLVQGQMNMLPETFRRYADLLVHRKPDEIGKVLSDLVRTIQYTNPWSHTYARVVKMFMRVLRLPGWEGGMREPCRMPSETVLQKFADGLLRLRVPEIDDMAKAAGLSIPG